VRTVPRLGRLVVNGGDAALARVLARGCWSEVERFGLAEVAGTGPDWTIAVDGTILLGGAPQGTLRWPADAPQLGVHNRMNALAAIAAARHAGVPVARALDALAAFRGVTRRMEVRGRVAGIAVYDDFAHHPTAIATTIDGLRRAVGPAARILAVLEPRSNTMKLGAMKDRLAESLAGAERTYCYAANLGWDAAAALAPLGPRASTHEDLDALVAAVVLEARSGDHVIVMSNGGFGGVHRRLLDALGKASGPKPDDVRAGR
jgi:UDP-N-acetylmuramate: L-alanyl-gamma-D-glutamyl-meso-diaminopimelate ligase